MISCHQGFILYSNTKNWKFYQQKNQPVSMKKTIQESLKLNDISSIESLKIADKIKESSNHINIKELLIQTSSQLIVPMFFSLLAISLTYSIIGFTTCFDSVKTYCIITGKFYKKIQAK